MHGCNARVRHKSSIFDTGSDFQAAALPLQLVELLPFAVDAVPSVAGARQHLLQHSPWPLPTRGAILGHP